MEKLLKDLTKKFDKYASLNECYVEEELMVDVKYVRQTKSLKMIVDSGAPLSIVSERWLKN